jgi:peptide/nickel transport system ATP-binding protein
MIAMALAGQPRLLIADEPTTALDVTIQAQVLNLLAQLQQQFGMGILLITHDLGVVAKLAHRIGVMYAGELVEQGQREDFFRQPLHPYTQKLFAALPDTQRREQHLATLTGQVPSLGQKLTGCRFAPRCPSVLELCHQHSPEWHSVGNQQVRCHHYRTPAHPVVPLPPPATQPPATQVAPSSCAATLVVENLSVHFPLYQGWLRRAAGWVRAVDGVSLTVAAGQTVALVGESGCGKTTTGRAILQLQTPSGGQVHYAGQQWVGQSGKDLQPLRTKMQMVFQDPFASLNPRMRVGEILEEGMIALDVEANPNKRQAILLNLLNQVGLPADCLQRYPHEFSGGQRQRIAIARCLAVSPQLLICDEPTSALDVSVQAQILNLMRRLQQQLGLAYLLITHNLAVVSYLADWVAVMYLGRIVEQGPAAQLLHAPLHPYTQALLAAVPKVSATPSTDTDSKLIQGELPSPVNPPSGCHFHPRCPQAQPICRASYPEAQSYSLKRTVHCHFPLTPPPVKSPTLDQSQNPSQPA